MAGKLDRELSDDDLAALREAIRPPADQQKLSSKQVARRIADAGDPHIADVMSRAMLGCIILH